MTTLRIRGGRVVDPAHGVDATRDVWVRNGRIVAGPDGSETRTGEIDATGCVVMAGGIDLHTH
ncbi:MAG TPA: formylmethanofuran dehydrogenase subunit A, partial [Ideonella sp.]|nr:formylmethanofuran dehydrogenase subunit A [Ideonella sp.]